MAVGCTTGVAEAAKLEAASTPELTAALQAAAASGEPDVIELAAGEYVGPFSYSAGSPGNSVVVRGAGRDATVIRTGDGGDGLWLNGSSGNAVEQLSVVREHAGSVGLRLTSGGTARDVGVETVDGLPSGGYGVVLLSAELDDADIYTGTSNAGAVSLANGTNVVRDVRITAPAAGGIRASGNASYSTLERVQIAPGGTAAALTASADAKVVVTDSFIDLRDGGRAVRAFTDSAASGGPEITASRLTIVGRSGNVEGVVAGPLASAGQTATVNVSDSIIHSVATPLRTIDTSGSPTIEALRSNGVSEGNVGAGVTVADAVDGSPGFVDAAEGDFRLRYDSPLLDAGDAGLAAGGFDVSGAERVVDGDGDGVPRVDLGAYEYRRSAPMVTVAAPTSLAAGQVSDFLADGLDADPGEVLEYAWQFGDGMVAEGPAVAHAYAQEGAYTVTVTAADPTGQTASEQVQVQVVAPGGPNGAGGLPGSGDQPPAAPQPTPPHTTGRTPVADIRPTSQITRIVRRSGRVRAIQERRSTTRRFAGCACQ